MFIDNKYSKIYFNLINQVSKLTRDGYLEKHHIVPKSLGGSNSKENLVALTFREHFICHRLLPRFTIGNDRVKMLRALGSMGRRDKSKNYYHLKIIQYAGMRVLKLLNSEKLQIKPAQKCQHLLNLEEYHQLP